MRWLQSRRKGPPCFGFVRTLAHIISVGQYMTLRSPSAILLRMKKYLHLMCLVRLELKKEPLTSSHMVDWLSWKRMFCSMEYPWASIKYLVWRIEDRAWSAPMSLDSVELLELILCLFEKLMVVPLPSDIIAPVWPRQSLWTAWEESTHHLRQGCWLIG